MIDDLTGRMLQEVTKATAIWDEDVIDIHLYDEKGFVRYTVYLFPLKKTVTISRLYTDDEKYWRSETLYDGEIEALNGR